MINLPAKFFSYGCIHCGAAVTSKKLIMCRMCEHFLKRSSDDVVPGAVLSAVSYSSPEAKSLIYYMKDNNDPYVFDYAASLIADKIRENELLDHLSDYYITYAPRNPKTVFKRHFDQAREIAEFLSIQLFDDDRVVSLFKRYPFASEQKGLGSSHRKENAREIFSLNEKAVLPEKVIIVDDVTTTGSTLFVLRDILLDAGVRECFLCTVAVNDKKYDY